MPVNYLPMSPQPHREPLPKTILRWLLAIAMTTIGVLHFPLAHKFEQVVPPYLAAGWWLVIISGVFEIAGGVGLLIPQTRRAAAWGLVALFIAVFPANVHHYFADVAIDGRRAASLYHPLRMPAQFLLVALAWWLAQPEEPA